MSLNDEERCGLLESALLSVPQRRGYIGLSLCKGAQTTWKVRVRDCRQDLFARRATFSRCFSKTSSISGFKVAEVSIQMWA